MWYCIGGKAVISVDFTFSDRFVAVPASIADFDTGSETRAVSAQTRFSAKTRINSISANRLFHQITPLVSMAPEKEALSQTHHLLSKQDK